jgi:hypothetical protein
LRNCRRSSAATMSWTVMSASSRIGTPRMMSLPPPLVTIGPSLRLQRAGRSQLKHPCRARCGGCASAASNCAVTPLPTCSQAHSDPGRGKGQGGHIYLGRPFLRAARGVGASFSRPAEKARSVPAWSPAAASICTRYATGVDILTISRRLGHANPKITPSVYGHLYCNTDDKAAQAVEAMFARIGGTE